MRSSKAWLAILVGGLLTGARLPGDAAGRGVELAIRDRTNANASVAARGAFVALAWGATAKEGVTDIYLATSRDGGQAFGLPTRVTPAGGGANLSGEQPPRVALLPRPGHDPSIVVVWTAKAAGGTRLASARSDDGGRSFAAPTPVPGGDATGTRGWESVVALPDGGVAAVWLDHRQLASGRDQSATMNAAEHQHGAPGDRPVDRVARAQLSQLFFARLDAADSSRALAGGVCYCCKTAMATGPDGSIYAAWRHVYEGNVRDIAFTMSSDGGRTFRPPVRVSEDHWALEGCPENGPALAVDAGRRIHVIWPTLVHETGGEPTLALFYATSQDGRGFTPRLRIPTEGMPRHPQIALGVNGDVIIVWDEQADGRHRVALARGAAAGTRPTRFVRQAIRDDASAAYPVVATAAHGTIVAWTSGPAGASVVRTQLLK